jgi:hypothetical protein
MLSIRDPILDLLNLNFNSSRCHHADPNHLDSNPKSTKLVGFTSDARKVEV